MPADAAPRLSDRLDRLVILLTNQKLIKVLDETIAAPRRSGRSLSAHMLVGFSAAASNPVIAAA